MKLLLCAFAIVFAQETESESEASIYDYEPVVDGDAYYDGDVYNDGEYEYDGDLSDFGRRNRRPGRPVRPARPAVANQPNAQAGFGSFLIPPNQAPPAVAAAPAADVADERYFFTATTVPTTVTTTPSTGTTTEAIGQWCWKCDRMSYADCASLGKYHICEQGDRDCCFIEVREKYGQLRQLCTGCKARVACENLRKENFNPVNDVTTNPTEVPYELTDQCRPDYINQNQHMRYGAQSSVCRQCFKTCNKAEFGGAYCFGSINDANTPATRGVFFTIPFLSHTAKYPSRPGTQVDSDAIGIPTHALVDAALDSAVGDIENFVHHNIYFAKTLNNDASQGQCASNCHGKTRANVGDSKRQLDEMVFWGLQGASKQWWQSDLKTLQQGFAKKIADGCSTENNPGAANFFYSGCNTPLVTADF